MSRRWIERGLWLTTAVAACTGALELHAEIVGAARSAPVPVIPSLAAVIRRPTPDSLESAVGDIADGNLFRSDRESADERAAPMPVPMGMPPVASSKPRLVLKGILGGPPWDAIIEGIPGRDGAVVVRAGQSVAGVAVRSVRRDTVFARGFDTTWALILPR